MTLEFERIVSSVTVIIRKIKKHFCNLKEILNLSESDPMRPKDIDVKSLKKKF